MHDEEKRTGASDAREHHLESSAAHRVWTVSALSRLKRRPDLIILANRMAWCGSKLACCLWLNKHSSYGLQVAWRASLGTQSTSLDFCALVLVLGSGIGLGIWHLCSDLALVLGSGIGVERWLATRLPILCGDANGVEVRTDAACGIHGSC